MPNVDYLVQETGASLAILLHLWLKFGLIVIGLLFMEFVIWIRVAVRSSVWIKVGLLGT